MIRFALDEDFNENIVDGFSARVGPVDILDAKDAGMRGASDEEVLEWAARQGRVLLSHDRQTLVPKAGDRIKAGLPMPGLIVMPQQRSMGRCIDDLVDIFTYEDAEMWDYRIEHLPLS